MKEPKMLQRRDFIGQSLAGAAAISLSGLGSFLHSKNVQAQSADDFKALVFLFLAGGNDSYNMIAPVSGALRTRYDSGRGFIALPSQSLHGLNLVQPADLFDGATHSDFGFHPNCPQIAQMLMRVS